MNVQLPVALCLPSVYLYAEKKKPLRTGPDIKILINYLIYQPSGQAPIQKVCLYDKNKTDRIKKSIENKVTSLNRC